MRPYRVVWKGPVRRATGLGIASRAYVRALRRQGVDVVIGGPRGDGGQTVRRPRVLLYHYAPNTLNIRRARRQFRAVILNTVWETTRIPKRWRGVMNQADAVCVPSQQNRQAMRDSGVKVPIYLVPHGVDTRTFNPRNRKLPLKEANGRFVFVSVFGFQHRKNPEALLRAYWEAFSAKDAVLLIIKTNGYASYENERWIKDRIHRYKKSLGIRKPTAPVILMASRMSTKQLGGLYTRGNAFVLPTRGEGVGLPFMEAMASGLPVIATDWGGHMDFLNARNAFLVKSHLSPPSRSMSRTSAISRPFRSLFAEKGQLWAEPDIGSLKRQMRTAYANPQLCRLKGRQGRHDAIRLSWNRAGQHMKKVIDQVLRTSQ